MTLSMYTSLYEHLAADTAVSAAVGAGVYAAGNAGDDATLPYITIGRVANTHIRHQSDAADVTSGMWQVDVWADDPQEADDLFEKVRQALERYTGSMGSTTPVTVHGCFLQTDMHMYEEPTDATSGGAYRVSSDWMIWHAEDALT